MNAKMTIVEMLETLALPEPTLLLAQRYSKAARPFT